MRTARLALFLLPAVLAGACKKDTPPEPIDLGYDYFPTTVGSWVEYQVDSLWRDDVAGVLDSVGYRLRERIHETYTDPAGRPALRILREVRDPRGNWAVRDVWTATRSATAAEKMEENLRRLKLSFPVREGRSWDMNVFNTEPELRVALREVDLPRSVNGLSFESTAIVRNTLPPNLVDRRDFMERYAKGVGLVEKDWEETNTQFDRSAQRYVVRGFRLRMAVVAHGTD